MATRGDLAMPAVYSGQMPPATRLLKRAPPDVSTIAALCRMNLEAHSLGCSIRNHDVSDELRQLIELAGLTELLLCETASGKIG